MATFTRSHQWKQWHGSLDDLVTAVSLTHEALRDHGSSKEDLPTRVDYSIGSLSIEEDRIEALLEVDARDLHRLKDLWIRTHSEDTSVSLRAGDGVSLEVQGNDVTHVEGVSSRLRERLGRGARKVSWWNRDTLVPLTFLLAIGLTLIGLALTEDADPEKPGLQVGLAFLLAILGAVVLVAAVLHYLFPNLEVIERDGRTRFQRFGGWAGALLLSLIASLIFFFIESGLNP